MGKTRVMKDEKRMKKGKGRNACCDREGVRRGAWSDEEDKILVDFITLNGHGTWRNLPKLAGLLRCGKSCRLRWTNYLRPDIKRGPFSPDEENTIIHLQGTLGNKWAAIASHLPGRTDNDIKNYFNTRLRKRLACKILDRTSSPESGESFRNGNRSTNEMDGATSHSPSSQTTSLAKCEMEAEDAAAVCSDLTKLDDESDAMLKLLLDFPVGGDDMIYP